jgi:hypothetical protein
MAALHRRLVLQDNDNFVAYLNIEVGNPIYGRREARPVRCLRSPDSNLIHPSRAKPRPAMAPARQR